jgi:hypothetical protein
MTLHKKALASAAALTLLATSAEAVRFDGELILMAPDSQHDMRTLIPPADATFAELAFNDTDITLRGLIDETFTSQLLAAHEKVSTSDALKHWDWSNACNIPFGGNCDFSSYKINGDGKNNVLIYSSKNITLNNAILGNAPSIDLQGLSAQFMSAFINDAETIRIRPLNPTKTWFEGIDFVLAKKAVAPIVETPAVIELDGAEKDSTKETSAAVGLNDENTKDVLNPKPSLPFQAFIQGGMNLEDKPFTLSTTPNTVGKILMYGVTAINIYIKKVEEPQTAITAAPEPTVTTQETSKTHQPITEASNTSAAQNDVSDDTESLEDALQQTSNDAATPEEVAS